VSTAALGSRSAAVGDATELRIRDLERAMGRIASRTLNGSPGYDAKRISATTSGWAVGTWVKLISGTWTSAATSSSFAPDAIGVVLTVVDSTTAEIVTGGFVQLLGTSYTNGALYYLSTSAGTPTSTPPAAPNVLQPLFVAYQDGWINVLGPAGAAPRSVTLAGLRDVTLTTPAGGELLKYDAGTAKWINGTLALTALSDVVITAVASNQVLSWDSGTSKWINRTLTSVTTLAGLSDVTITSVADLDFLRYDAGSAKWKNYSLGLLAYVGATGTLLLDGGSTAATPTIVGIAGANSRLLLSQTTNPLDFVLSGSVTLGTDKSARIRRSSANAVGFYDQATATVTAGDKVMEWGCDTTYAARYFCALIPLQVRDDSGAGTKNLIVKSTAAQTWTIGEDVTPGTWLTMLGASADSYGRRIKLGCDLDNAGGWTLYGDRSNGTSSSRLLVGATDGTWYQSGNLNLTAGTAINLSGSGTNGVQIGSGGTSDKIGFWGHAGATKTTVADPSAITVSGTATGTDAAMVNALKTDVTNLRATLLAATDALQAVGLF
jgi:hypothetical protein